MDDEKPKWPVICSPQEAPLMKLAVQSDPALNEAVTVQAHPWLPKGEAIVVNPESKFLAPDVTTPRILDYRWAMPLFAIDTTSSLLREQLRYEQYLVEARLFGVDQWAARRELLDVYEELKVSPVYFDPHGRALYRLADRALRAYRLRRSWTRPPRLCIDGHAYRRRQRARRRRKR